MEDLDGPGCAYWFQVWDSAADLEIFERRLRKQLHGKDSSRATAKHALWCFHSHTKDLTELEQDATQQKENG